MRSNTLHHVYTHSWQIQSPPTHTLINQTTCPCFSFLLTPSWYKGSKHQKKTVKVWIDELQQHCRTVLRAQAGTCLDTWPPRRIASVLRNIQHHQQNRHRVLMMCGLVVKGAGGIQHQRARLKAETKEAKWRSQKIAERGLNTNNMWKATQIITGNGSRSTLIMCESMADELNTAYAHFHLLNKVSCQVYSASRRPATVSLQSRCEENSDESECD